MDEPLRASPHAVFRRILDQRSLPTAACSASASSNVPTYWDGSSTRDSLPSRAPWYCVQGNQEYIHSCPPYQRRPSVCGLPSSSCHTYSRASQAPCSHSADPWYLFHYPIHIRNPNPSRRFGVTAMVPVLVHLISHLVVDTYHPFHFLHVLVARLEHTDHPFHFLPVLVVPVEHNARPFQVHFHSHLHFQIHC